jgi:cystathionine gamma-lyase
MTSHPLSPASLILHSDVQPRNQGDPFVAGPTFASTFHLSGDPAGTEYQYGRFDNPTWKALETTIAGLEHGEAVCFASGMAAVAAVLAAYVEPGDTVVLPEDGYYTTRLFAETYLARWGANLRFIPTISAARAAFEGVRLVWIESPSNPGLDVCDIEVTSEAAHAAGALVAVDNTTATVLAQVPLDKGADFSVASDTKALNGHSDVVMGHVAAARPQLVKPLRLWRTLAGGIPGPMEAWLVHRGLMTLDLRLKRQCESAAQVAKLLSEHPNVSNVRYPGLPTDRSYEIARRQMNQFGFVIGFELQDAAAAQKFLTGCKGVFEATSFGGVHSTAERRARWASDRVAEGFIRLSVGCEAVEDLLAHIASALDAL